MTSECLSREILYLASLSPFKKMLSEGLITAGDYTTIESLLCEKYHPVIVSRSYEKPVEIIPIQR